MPRKRGPKPLQSVLQEQPARFRKLFDTADALSELQQRLIQSLPTNLKNKVDLRFFRSGILSVNVPSGVGATMLRMHEAEILNNLRKHHEFRNLIRLEIKVRPKPTRQSKQKQAREISDENAQLLKQVAETTEDEALKETLERLASRADKHTN